MIRSLLPLVYLLNASRGIYSYTGLASSQSFSFGMIQKARRNNQRNKSQKRN